VGLVSNPLRVSLNEVSGLGRVTARLGGRNQLWKGTTDERIEFRTECGI